MTQLFTREVDNITMSGDPRIKLSPLIATATVTSEPARTVPHRTNSTPSESVNPDRDSQTYRFRYPNGFQPGSAQLLQCHPQKLRTQQELKKIFLSSVLGLGIQWAKKIIDAKQTNPSGAKQALNQLDFYFSDQLDELSQVQWDNDYHLDSKLKQAFQLTVVSSLFPESEITPTQAKTLLSEIKAQMSENAQLHLARKYSGSNPLVLELLGSGWEATRIPDRVFTDTPPANQRSAEELTAMGARRIGHSPFFEKGPFVVELKANGPPSIYADYPFADPAVRSSGVIDAHFDGKSFSLFLQYCRQGVVTQEERAPSGSGMVGKSIQTDYVPDWKTRERMTLEEQLRESGFSEDQNDPGVFRLEINDYGSRQTTLAFAHEGILQRVVVSLAIPLSPASRVTGIGSLRTPLSQGTDPSLTVQDPLFETTFTAIHWPKAAVRKPLVPLEKIPKEILGMPILQPDAVMGSEFIVGGKNETALIRQLSGINGISIGQLEDRMRPGRYSDDGFLGRDEGLLDVLAKDNDFVLKRGLSHAQMAEPLRYMVAAFHMGLKGQEVIYRDRRFKIDGTGWMGYQDSPFQDGTKTAIDLVITNVDKGETVGFSGLLPDMIERYGFYEGHGTPYRLDPKDILRVFDFLDKPSKK